jgi:hypothetical protein
MKIKELLKDPRYRVEEDGTIYTLVTQSGKLSKDGIFRFAGYYNKRAGYYSLRYNGSVLLGHRVIYCKFKGALDHRLTINHIDGDPRNNCPDNLELVSQSENNKHSFRKLGRNPVIGNHKINKKIADKIREEYKITKSYNKLARKYKVSKSTIAYVIKNKIWK